MSRKKPLLWLVHGWGFGPGVWRPLMARLADWPVVRGDLGFFGPSAHLTPPDQPYVAVGHSLGFLRLLHDLADDRCLGLVGVNGFSRFCGGTDFPQGISPRLVQRMIARLAESPGQVLREFRQRGGMANGAEPAGQGQGESLRHGLQQLLTLDGRGAMAAWSKPCLLLAAQDDVIVPPSLTNAAFPPPALIHWSATGGHVLPWLGAEWCGEQLVRWVDKYEF